MISDEYEINVETANTYSGTNIPVLTFGRSSLSHAMFLVFTLNVS